MRADRSVGLVAVAGPRIDSRAGAWLMAAAAATALIAYVPFFKSLASVSARHPYAGHVVFVPIFAAALLWLERHRFRRLAEVGHASGAAVMVLALGLLAFGYTSASVPLQAL